MMSNDDILKTMRERYVSETGLGRLVNWETDTSIAPNGEESVQNENGILYRMLAIIQAVRAGAQLNSLDKAILSLGLTRLRRFPNDPAITNRQPHGNVTPTRSEAHDNAVGLVLADWYLGQPGVTANAMISHWWHNYFCIDNVNPGKFSWAQFRQPGEIALYYIAANRRSPLLFTLWMLVGILINAKKSISGEASRLTFMRLFLIDQMGVKGFMQRFLYRKVRAYWFKRLAEKFGGDGISPIMLQYGDGHPIAEFQKVIDAKV